MIKINLLQVSQGKRKSATDAQGEKSLLIGAAVVALCALLAWVLIHRPYVSKVDKQKTVNKKLKDANEKIKTATKNFDKLKKELEASERQAQSIKDLNNSRATPAWLLHELSRILTRGQSPSITAEKQEQMDNNPNLRWQSSWDPKHIWLTGFDEKNGTFEMTGAAQSDGDVTQLAHRLDASMFFENVQPMSSSLKSSRNSGSNYYEFKIKGKVRY